MIIFNRDSCNNCGSNDLEWNCSLTSNSGVQDGRLKYNEIQVIFYLGCNYCSETVQVVSEDKMLQKINEDK